MTYTVEKDKDKFFVLDKALEINERWIFEAFLLGDKISQAEDVVLSFLEYLVEKYPSVCIERGAIIDPTRNAFTGLSTIEISFSKESEAKSYADELNSNTLR